MLALTPWHSFPKVLAFLKVQTRIINARHSHPSIIGPLPSLPRGHRQAERAPTCGKGPAGGAASQAPGAFKRPRGAAGTPQSCAGAHGAPGDAAGDSRAGRRGPSGGVRLGPADGGRRSGRPGGARSPPGAVSYALPEPPLGRAGPRAATALPARTPVRPALSLTPRSPGHSPRGQAAAAAPAAPAVAGPAWRGLGPGSRPGRPAPGGRCGRAGGLRTGRGRRDDSAAAAGLQRTQG